MRSERDGILSLQRFFAGVLPEPWDIRTELEAGKPPERPFALIEESGPGGTDGAPGAQEITLVATANLYLERADTRAEATDAALLLREQVWQAVKWGPDARRPTTDRIPLFVYEPREARHRFQVTGATGGTFTVTVGGSDDTAPLDPAGTATDLATAIAAVLDTDAGNVVGHDRGTGVWDVYYVGDLAGVDVGEPDIDGTSLAGAGAAATAVVLLEAAASPWRGPSDYMRVVSFSQQTVRDQSDPALVMVPVDLRLTFVRGRRLPLDHRILQRVIARP